MLLLWQAIRNMIDTGCDWAGPEKRVLHGGLMILHVEVEPHHVIPAERDICEGLSLLNRAHLSDPSNLMCRPPELSRK